VDSFGLICSLVAAALLLGIAGFGYFLYTVQRDYLGVVVRIFEEKPFFKIRTDLPVSDAEEHHIQTRDGLTLAGCLVRSPQHEKKGLVIFAPEFGGTRWSCVHYAGHLLDAGYDLFAFDFRNQGDSDYLHGYQPLQWVTQNEARDFRAVVEYVKEAPFCPVEGIGVFGVSRGAGAAIVACAGDPFVKCVVTDGAFGTVATMVRFMQKWVSIYSDRINLQRWLPNWFYGFLSVLALREVKKRRHLQFPSVRNALRRLKRQQLFMVHGKADGYIRSEIALDLHRAAPRKLCRLWMVENAKHNQAIDVAEDEYKVNTAEFFLEHLQTTPVPASMPQLDLQEFHADRGEEFTNTNV
jgi:pimeloyl-ACP methyl ester carboxylesterase